MNKNILKGKWLEIKGRIKEKWGKLTDNDHGEIEGKGEKLLGLLQKKCGYIRDKAEMEYKDSLELAEIVSSISEIMKKKILWQLHLLLATGSLCSLRNKRVK